MSGGAPLPPSQMPLRKVHAIQFEIFKEKQIKDYAVCLVEHAKSYEHGEPVRGGLNDLRMGTTDFDRTCETCGLRHPDCPGHFGYLELAEPLFHIGVFDMVLTTLKCVCKYCGALLFDAQDPSEMKKVIHYSGLNRLRAVARLSGGVCRARTVAHRVDTNYHSHTGDSPGDALFGRDAHHESRANPSSPMTRVHGCGSKQPRVGRFQGIYPGLQIKATLDEHDLVWHGDVIRAILDRVSDTEARVMGFDPLRCHPRDLLLTVLPIPPPQVRPAISFGAMQSDDELTHQILSILKRNAQLRRDKDSNVQAAIDRSRALLQEYVATYIHNASTAYRPTKVNDTKRLKSLTERLKGKYGRLRGNLMGKRVDFSARTVITGDPNIDVDEVGVPFSIAMTLTFPERVNALNKKRLTEFVQRAHYPSANYIVHENGTLTKLALVKDRASLSLSVGDVVERHVINGDVVLFNRQPTLHRMSMMGHRVRVLNYNTFRLNLSCTTPYNADFDGDEMNMHVPQSLLTKAELVEMMMVPKNFVSPNKSAPCMGIVQDSLLGSYRLTDKDTFLDKYFVQSLALWIDRWELPPPAVLLPRPLWTGKQVFSLILPEVNHPAAVFESSSSSSRGGATLSSSLSSTPFPHHDKQIWIQRGQLLMGAITKSVVGAAPGSLIHVIFNERGSDEVARFINGVQRITTFFLYHSAFSVGVQDTVADADTLRQMNEVLVKTRENVEKIGAAANNRTLARKAGMTLLQSFEADVNSALNKCREEAARKALSHVRRTNSFKVMIEAGSKGTDLNICQIAVFVGQQNVAGSRIPFGFRRRTLPHFMLDDYGETSRGMANRGYVEGLKPHEFYFHTMAGREGLIDTAVKTSDTGYLQRKLIKALEDVHAAYDGTVRNAQRELVQLMYGEDGLDGARIEGGQLFALPHLSDLEMARRYRYGYDENGRWTSELGSTHPSSPSCTTTTSRNSHDTLDAHRREYHATNHSHASFMHPVVTATLAKEPQSVRILQAEYDQLMHDRTRARALLEMEEKSKLKLNLPVNVARLIQNARSTMLAGRRATVSNLSPLTVIEGVRQLQEDLSRLFASHHRAAGHAPLHTHPIDRVPSSRRSDRPHPYHLPLHAGSHDDDMRHSAGLFQDALCHERVEHALTLFKIHLRQMLGSKRVLQEYRLNDKAFEFLLKEVRTKYQQALITPGEVIGAIAAQSCGEPATQMTLNTFHNAGISSKNVTLGVPRLLELLNVSRHQRHASMTVALRPAWRRRERAQKAQHWIEYCTLASITTTVQIIYDPDLDHTVVDEDAQIVWLERAVGNDDEESESESEKEAEAETEDGAEEAIPHAGHPPPPHHRANQASRANHAAKSDGAPPSPFIARLILDSDVFNDKQLNMKDVKAAIRAVDDGYLVQAKMENTGKRVVRLRPRTFEGADSVPALLQKIPRLLAAVHLLGIAGVKKTLLKEGTVFVCADDTPDEAGGEDYAAGGEDYAAESESHAAMRRRRRTSHPAEDGALRSVKAWMIDTEGTALRRVFVGVLDKSHRNLIDFRRTRSNKVPEVAAVLGIEAARRTLLSELREAYLAYGLNINYRHYTVLVDTMCQRGTLMAVSRAGMNRSEMSGPLTRSSFEETVKILTQAAVFGEVESMRGVSANVVLGHAVPIGTGLFDVLLDLSALQQAVPQAAAVAPRAAANVYHGLASVLDSAVASAEEPTSLLLSSSAAAMDAYAAGRAIPTHDISTTVNRNNNNNDNNGSNYMNRMDTAANRSYRNSNKNDYTYDDNRRHARANRLATPMVNDVSVWPRGAWGGPGHSASGGGGGSASSVVPYAAGSALYGAAAREASAVHGSQVYPARRPRGGDGDDDDDDGAVATAGSFASASVFAPMLSAYAAAGSGGGSVAVSGMLSEAYSEASSFHLQSSAMTITSAPVGAAEEEEEEERGERGERGVAEAAEWGGDDGANRVGDDDGCDPLDCRDGADRAPPGSRGRDHRGGSTSRRAGPSRHATEECDAPRRSTRGEEEREARGTAPVSQREPEMVYEDDEEGVGGEGGSAGCLGAEREAGLPDARMFGVNMPMPAGTEQQQQQQQQQRLPHASRDDSMPRARARPPRATHDAPHRGHVAEHRRVGEETEDRTSRVLDGCSAPCAGALADRHRPGAHYSAVDLSAGLSRVEADAPSDEFSETEEPEETRYA